MLSRLARLALLAELLAYTAIGVWLHRQGWNLASIVAVSFAAALALRMGFVAASMFLSWIVASPRAAEVQIGTKATLSLIADEYRAVLASNFLDIPFEQLLMPREREPAPGEGIPVILVHGFFGNRGYFGTMLRRLEERGVSPVFIPNFSATFATIERFADELHEAIERIVAGTGQGRVILVCHSMGGLAARRYLATQGPGRVAKLITLASPHGGTRLARLGLGENAAQMRLRSRFLTDLAREEGDRMAYAATSIYSPHDNMVAPQDTSRLAWADNIPVPGVGHITILLSKRAFDVLLAELEKAGVRVAG